MRLLFVASEIAPWVKTGGLGDVAGALPAALARLGIDVRILVPRYPALRSLQATGRFLERFASLGGAMAAAELYEASLAPNLCVWLLDCPDYYDRPGNPYLGPEGRDWLDNHLRFGLLSRLAARLASPASPLAWRPDVLFANDWQAALAPYYLRFYEPAGSAKSVLAIHNLAFQGVFPPQYLDELGLFARDWHIDGVEYYGQISFLKAGIRHADKLVTVSPTYAREIATEAGGMGLGGLLAARAADLVGIVNGIDTEIWNPARDVYLDTPYDLERLADKRRNTEALRAEYGLASRADVPLVGVVSRLTHQKGHDLVAQIGEDIVELPAQLIVLGTGEAAIEVAFRALALRHPANVGVTIGYDERLAHRIEAGADFFLMPSRFEPCGLNQLYSQAYGTPPIVTAVGGLADTVVDATPENIAAGLATGFVCPEASPTAILAALTRAVRLWREEPEGYRQLQRVGMSRDYGWDAPARRYLALFRALLGESPWMS
ncbi:MAG: glycogen synthase GlgA [Rhodocyclaceae bacterium]|nr:glycogen synthase GlgA [Rhodocyclaceae bacterium]